MDCKIYFPLVPVIKNHKDKLLNMSYDPLDVSGSNKALLDSKERRKLENKKEGDDIDWLMSDQRGRRIVNRLLEQAGMFRSSFNTNALTMAFNEGNKNQGLRLMAILNDRCHENYQLMIEEAMNDRSSDK